MVGEKAIRECINDARNIADKSSGPERMELLKLCNEVEKLTDELADLKRRGLVSNESILFCAVTLIYRQIW